MRLSVDSSRYAIEAAIGANSVDLNEAKKNHPKWFTVVAQFGNSSGERGWTTLNTVSASTGNVTTFVTDDEELAEAVALIMVADNGLPAYVRTLREASIGLPDSDSPYWDYARKDWKKTPRVF